MGIGEGRVEPLRLGEDAACTSFVDIAPKVDAPPVFVGYGLKVPEKGYDDFADLDLKGKIAVTIPGSPSGVDGEIAAHYTARRWHQFREAGLIGWVFMTGPSAPWASLAANVGQRCISTLHTPTRCSTARVVRRRSCSLSRGIESRCRTLPCQSPFAPPPAW